MYTLARLLLSKVEPKTISQVEAETILKVRAETVSKALKVMEEEGRKEIGKQGCENWDRCKEFVQNTKIYENMANRWNSLEKRMYNVYQKFKNTPVGCVVNNSLCRVISEVDDVIQLVNKRNTVKQMPTPQVRMLATHLAIQQAAERLSIEMPMSQDKMLSLRQSIQQAAKRLSTLSSCSTSNHTLSTSSSKRSSTINDASTDASSAFSPTKLPDQKTGGKSQGIGE